MDGRSTIYKQDRQPSYVKTGSMVPEVPLDVRAEQLEGKGWVEDGASDDVVEVRGVGVKAERIGLKRRLQDRGFAGRGRQIGRFRWR